MQSTSLVFRLGTDGTKQGELIFFCAYRFEQIFTPIMCLVIRNTIFRCFHTAFQTNEILARSSERKP